MKKTRFSYINGASKKLIALISALAIIIGCAAAMTAPVTAEDDGVDWFLNRSKKTTYEEYVEHGAVDKYGDFDDSGHGDMVDVLSAYLVASGIIEPTNCLYDDPDTIAWNMRSHGRFEPPCDEWRRLHGQPVQNHDWVDCLYEPMALYYRICAGTDNPLSGPEDPRATTTTEETTTTTERVVTPENTPLLPEYVPTWPEPPKPTPGTYPDEREISRLIVQKINAYRVAAGGEPIIQLARASLVAEYRSKQLYSDFSHNWEDTMEACAAYQYGHYVETMPGYGYYYPSMSTEYANSLIEAGKPYDFVAGECIQCTWLEPTADMIATEIVESYRNSPSHWNIIMAGTKESTDPTPVKWVGVGCNITKDDSCYNCLHFFCTDEYE